MIYLDTHIVAWLYAGEKELLTTKTAFLIKKNELFISPIVQLELQYLIEVKRIKGNSLSIIEYLQKNIGLKICQQNFSNVISKSIENTWTRDPFDRIIVAQAALARKKLISKDKMIRKHYKLAEWD